MGNQDNFSTPVSSDPRKHVEWLILLSWLRSHPTEAEAVVTEVLSVLSTLIANDPIHVFPVSDCEDAFSFRLSNRSKCRVQLQFHT